MKATKFGQWMRRRKPLRGGRAPWIVAAVVIVVAIAASAALVAHRRSGAAGTAASEGHAKYQCSMHPQIVQDHPGDCPICHMHLEKVEGSEPAGAAALPAKHKIVKYRHPMNPSVFSDKPMKDEMGMDYVPVYADETGGGGSVPGKGGFTLSEHRQQMIGVRTTPVARRHVVRTLRLPGRVSGGVTTLLAQLLEIDAGRVTAGMDAVIVGPEGQQLAAKITQVDDGLDTLTRSFPVGLEAQETAGWLRPGVFCEVRVPLDLGERLVIPTDAVLDTGDQQVVFVASGQGSFEPRKVRLGKEGDEVVEVSSGLKEGERVVTGANFLIDSESRFRAAIQAF